MKRKQYEDSNPSLLKKRKLNDLNTSSESNTISIWNAEPNLEEQLKNAVIRRQTEILQQLRLKLPIMRQQIIPKQLDLKTYSEVHGSFLFEVCKNGNLELIKYFIEKEKLNPHFVYPSGVNILHSVNSSPWGWTTGKELKFLVSLGCNLQLIYKQKDNKYKCSFMHFVANDDWCKYVNTKMVLSFGFELEEIVQYYQDSKCSMRNRIRLGFDGDIDEEFGHIQLLKPKNFMNKLVLENSKMLLQTVMVNIEIGKNISNLIFECLNVRDVCKIYQYTVNLNGWNLKEDCKWMQ